MISLIFEPTYQVRFVVYLIFFSRTAIQLKSIKLQSKMIFIYFSVFEKVGHKDQFKSLAFKSMDYQWSRSCIISYHNFYLFFPICKRKEFKLFQLLERFKKKNVLMHHPSIKKSLNNAWSMILKQFFYFTKTSLYSGTGYGFLNRWMVHQHIFLKLYKS